MGPLQISVVYYCCPAIFVVARHFLPSLLVRSSLDLQSSRSDCRHDSPGRFPVESLLISKVSLQLVMFSQWHHLNELQHEEFLDMGCHCGIYPRRLILSSRSTSLSLFYLYASCLTLLIYFYILALAPLPPQSYLQHRALSLSLSLFPTLIPNPAPPPPSISQSSSPQYSNPLQRIAWLALPP